VSIEDKAKAEAKKLMAEVGQLQAQVKSQSLVSKAETQKLIAEINRLQVAAIQERDSDKARQAKLETKRLYEEQLAHIAVRQNNIREQVDRLLLAKQKYETVWKRDLENGKTLDSQDSQLQQQLLQLIKKKKEDFVLLNREAEAIRERARQKSISLLDARQSPAATTSAPVSAPEPAVDLLISVADRAKAEAEKLIKEVTKPKIGDAATKAEEVGRMMAEINKLQMAADQGLLSEGDSKQLEDRVKKIESKQREARDQINQLTQAKIKYELALSRSAQQRNVEQARREQDEKLQEELNQLIQSKEGEQRRLMEELELIRMRSEQEAALLKAQRDAARALADQQAKNEDLMRSMGGRKGFTRARIIGSVLLVLLLGGGVAAFFMTPWLSAQFAARFPDKPSGNAPSIVAGAVTPATAEPAPPVAPQKPALAPVVRPVRTFRDKLSSGERGPEMVQLPGGSFRMGAPAYLPYSDERPQFEVTLDGFSISRREITFDEYRVFANSTGHKLPDDSTWGRGERPVINVSWDDASDYAAWLTKETGSQYQLPSEREWEYAAKAGTDTAYWWGDELGSNKANCGQCGSQWDVQQTAPVGSFQPNAFGLYDVIGNVMEWTRTCYHPNYEGAPPTGQDWVGGNCSQRMVRSSAFNNYQREVRVTKRKKLNPKSSSNNLGFRVVRVN